MSRGDAARIDRDPDVQRIAKSLGIVGPNLRAKLVTHSVEVVRRHLDRFRIEPATLADVHDVVLDLTRVKVQRVETDEQLRRLSKDLKRRVPVQLEFEFERNTEALVVRDPDADRRTPSFSAIIDARGDRRFRAWFSERHEPIHVLLPDPSDTAVWRRTTAERPEPLEQVIDASAAAIAFWEPLVRPELALALREESSMLDAFDRVRRVLAPDASQEASYRALVRLTRAPLVVLRTDFACRRGDHGNKERSLALRATTIMWNDAAEQAGMVVWRNFRIPMHSIIHEAQATAFETLMQDDDLHTWRTEKGEPLARRACYVRVTACGAWAAIETR